MITGSSPVSPSKVTDSVSEFCCALEAMTEVVDQHLQATQLSQSSSPKGFAV